MSALDGFGYTDCHPVSIISAKVRYDMTSRFPDGAADAMVISGMGVYCAGDACECKANNTITNTTTQE